MYTATVDPHPASRETEHRVLGTRVRVSVSTLYM